MTNDLPAIGSTYEKLYDAYLAGAHGHNQQGISRSKKTGRVSIIVKGAYEDDEDSGSEIVYTGEGGRDVSTKRQVSDQDPDFRGNRLLKECSETGEFVHVLRGTDKDSSIAPKSGYRYDGVYKVMSHWIKERFDGLKVVQFRLIQVEPVTESGLCKGSKKDS